MLDRPHTNALSGARGPPDRARIVSSVQGNDALDPRCYAPIGLEPRTRALLTAVPLAGALLREGLSSRRQRPFWAVTLRAVTIPKVAFTETKLPNGLRVIISVDHAAPVVSLVVDYDVGSRNEKPGKTGFAHLFEHLMYKGSQNVADGELAALIQNYGGDHNGQTDKDHTIYFEEVPANQLEMVLFLEADRMKALALTKENLANQLEAVKEERRFRVDNQPYGKTSELLEDLIRHARSPGNPERLD